MSSLDVIYEKLEHSKRYRNYIVGLCPFHDDSKPSFFVYEDNYFCKSCGAHGKTEYLVRKLSSLPERIHYYENIRNNSSNPFTRWLHSNNLAGCIETARRTAASRPSHYLTKRGISATYQCSLRLGILDGFITFPIFNHWSELVGAVARVGENNTASAKYYIPSGQDPKLLYVPSWDRIKQASEVLVTFGIIDAISLYIMGFASASTTTGQSVSPEAFTNIRKKIIFLPDKYEEPSALKIAAKLGWRGGCISLPFPFKCKDVNDWYLHDKELLYGYLGRTLGDRYRISIAETAGV